mmetsp:Transcript_43693/g.144671  ORF Transcript_43693/g.144671 Transcript_43693/m.144671 type:complete len:203 (+) Transcript_43693:598-1206(+)
MARHAEKRRAVTATSAKKWAGGGGRPAGGRSGAMVSAAADAPAICEAMYGSQSDLGRVPPTVWAHVIAGLKWAPEIVAKERTAEPTTPPMSSDVLVGERAAAEAALAARTRMPEPTASARQRVRRSFRFRWHAGGLSARTRSRRERRSRRRSGKDAAGSVSCSLTSCMFCLLSVEASGTITGGGDHGKSSSRETMSRVGVGV